MDNDKLDLILLTGLLRDGGAEVIATNLIANLPTFISKEIIVRKKSPHQDQPKNASSSLTQVLSRVIRKLPPPIKEILNICYLLPDVVKYICTLRKKQPSISLSVSCADNLINVISCLFCKTKPILSCHYIPSQYNVCGGYVMNKLTYSIARLSRVDIIAVSNSVSEDLRRYYHVSNKHIHVIYNPIDLRNVQIKSINNVFDSHININSPFIITVGRLNNVKGQWHIIRAFSELRKRFECQLIICGEGPEMDYLSKLVKDLKIEEDVVFLGWQDNPYKYMKRAKLLAHSSLSESFGNVIVEAMACGCPSVVARCSPAIEEVMGSDSSCGFISEKMSGIRYASTTPLDSGETDLLKKMVMILTDDELHRKMSLACVEHAKEFDVDVGIQKYVELIEKVANIP